MEFKVHPYRPIEILCVIDPHQIEDLNNEAKFENGQIRNFWVHASMVCDLFGGTGKNCPKVKDINNNNCAACPWNLTFYPWFPPAILDIAGGKQYDVIIADWVAHDDPTRKPQKNRIETWVDHVSYNNSTLCKIKSVINKDRGKVGGLELCLIAHHLIRSSMPFVAVYTTQDIRSERKAFRELIHIAVFSESSSATRGLSEIILQAGSYFEHWHMQLGLSVAPPNLDWSGDIQPNVDAIISFIDQPRICFSKDTELIVNDKKYHLSKDIIIPFSGGKKGEVHGKGRTAAIRHMMRMGTSGVHSTENAYSESWANAFNLNMKNLRIEDSEKAAVIEYLQQVCTHKENNKCRWLQPLYMRTTTDEAFSAIYHAVIGIALLINSSQNATFTDKAQNVLADDTSSRLHGDVRRYRCCPKHSGDFVQRLVTHAYRFGFYDRVIKPYCDVEFHIIPQVLELCLSHLMPSDSNIVANAQSIIENAFDLIVRLDQDCVRIGSHNYTLALLQSLGSIVDGNMKAVDDILATIFYIYRNAEPMYQQIHGLANQLEITGRGLEHV
ncbi:MAG: hypothetical protein FVQ84_18925 [Planctomycetes bacterium]|nr:hypothetical protein [Planctomycetota bacterium]